jgi:peptidoglycan hydrolase-like protein with peptidoglycan-binding domain
MRRADTDRGLTVSERVSPGRGETSGPADAPVSRHAAGAPESLRAPAGARKHGRFRWVVPGVAAVLVAGGVLAAWRAGVFSRPAASGGGQGAAAVTQPVVRANLSVQTPVDGTLGYAGSYTVTGAGGGTLTSLPSAGQVIRQGQVLYTTDLTDPVVLLYGSVPDWRALDEGVTGADVTQLNHDLVNLGYADSADISALGWDYFSWETKAAVEALQSAAGISSPSGSLAARSVVFEPEAIRVTSVLGSLGSPAAGPVLSGTTDRHVVSIALNTSDESEVAVGDAVSIQLPDGASTSGKVSSVGTVASGSGSLATVPVTVALADPSAVGSLDQAPVTVEITAESVRNVLAVPVSALLAQSPGGYAVEVSGPGNSRRLVPVTPGIFDDASSLVQVTGNLAPGQLVVVPAT